MLSMMAVTLQMVSSTSKSLRNQYYSQLAREGAEAGALRAKLCLEKNNYIAEWVANGKPLRPNTSCGGGDACTGSSNCYVASNSSYRITYEVGAPDLSVGVQNIGSVGKVELLRESDGSVYQSYSGGVVSRLGAHVTFDNVVFGYNYLANPSTDSVFFFTIAADGRIQGVGGNAYGQLGVGNTTWSVNPRNINMSLPAGEAVTSIFTSILSVGTNSFFVTNLGSVYGAGLNNYGSLGLGNTIDQSTPQKLTYYNGSSYVTFGGSSKRVQYVAVLGKATFILTQDGYLYSAGYSDYGVLGRSISPSNRFRQVNTFNASSSPLRPSSKIALDRTNVYVITDGGRVYGRGINDLGQLANGTRNTATSPIMISDYGDSSKPKAIQVAFDGDSVFVVDDWGNVKGAGRNDFGQIGKTRSLVVNEAGGEHRCMDGNSSDMYFYDCDTSNSWQLFEFQPTDNTIRRVVGGAEQCLDSNNGARPVINNCNGSAKQKFTYRPGQGHSIYSNYANKCLDNEDGNTWYIKLYPCDIDHSSMYWYLRDAMTMTSFDLPASAGTPIKVATDQWSTLVLGSNGEVWGAGLNASGQLGNGRSDEVQPKPVKFILPSGVKAVDVYNTASGMDPDGSETTNFNQANTFVVGDDGKVYGSGDNEYGQLGIGSYNDFISNPVAMNVIDGVSIRASKVQSGFGTTVVLTHSGLIYTVGNNSHGQLGDGTTTNSTIPKTNPYVNIIQPVLY